MQPQHLAVFAVLVLVLVHAEAVQPGFQVGLTDAGLDYARSVGIPLLIQEIQTISIPDINGDTDTPVGHVSYSLSQIHVTAAAIPQSSLDVSSDGLAVAFSGASLHLTARWHYREDSWPHVSDSGSADISGSNIHASLDVALGVTAENEPSVDVQTCSCAVDNLSVDLHGGASWLYNLFSGVIADALKSALNGQLCGIITNEINTEGNQALATLPKTEKLTDDVGINFELLAAPLANGTYVLTQHKGECYLVHNTTEAPFSPPDAPQPAAGSLTRMMYVWITDYLFETTAWAFMEDGALSFELLPSEVPSSFPLQLNTASFKLLLPQLYEAYPNLPMQIQGNAVGAPLEAYISSDGFTSLLQVQLDMQVVLQNNTIVDAFSFVATIDSSVFIWLAQEGGNAVVHGNLTFVNVTMELVASAIGPLDLSSLQDVMNLFCDEFLLVQINKKIQNGFPIPTVDGVGVVNPEVIFTDRVVMIGTDLVYSPKYFRE